jgi:hypothetical protein
MHAFSAACRRKTVNGVSSVLPIPCGGLQKSPLLFVPLSGLLIAAGAIFLLFAGAKKTPNAESEWKPPVPSSFLFPTLRNAPKRTEKRR